MGNFSYQAVVQALGHRRFDWCGVLLQRTISGAVDTGATVEAAFRPVTVAGNAQPILGIFVNQGHHFTAMIRREGTIYHIDSLLGMSGEGRYMRII